MGITTGIVLFDGAEELDFVGPWEVFTMGRREGDRVVMIAERDRPVLCAKGMRVLPDHTFADAPDLDVVVVPGGHGRRVESENPAMLDYLRRVAPGCTWVTSVCTGAFVLEGAGLVPDHRVTTHWASIGFNMVALWVLGQLVSVEHARTTQYAMEYDPRPPYAALV